MTYFLWTSIEIVVWIRLIIIQAHWKILRTTIVPTGLAFFIISVHNCKDTNPVPLIQLFQKMLWKEKQTSYKPRPQGSMGSLKSVFIAAVKTTTATPRKTSIKKVNLCFTYKSRGNIKRFCLLISVKSIAKLNLGHIDKSEIKI